MKCAFCGSEMLPGKDKCDYCGKYQHDANRPVEKEENNVEEKNINICQVLWTIIKFIVVVAIISVGVYFLLNYLNSQKVFYGKWRCSNGQIEINIDKKIISMDYGTNGFIESEYILDSEVIEDNTTRYSLNVSPTKKLKNGDEYTDSNLTSFDIVIEKDIKDKMTLENTITKDNYICYKASN